MKAPNHIAGGLVFTGIFCSFWDVNIFSKPLYLGITLFASLLPDIDHTRSLIGKTFLPVAKYLDRHFGHRTVTHSLLFYGGCLLMVLAASRFFAVENITLIFAFAMASHLIFDMMTVQGVPLFYPVRNPCVLGGNPELRLSGKTNAEVVVFAIFLLMLYFCFPLFTNGFWVSYNKNFNTLQHLHSSATRSDNLLQVDYDFRNNYMHRSGQGLLLFHEQNEAVILDDGQLVKIKAKDVIKKLQPTATAKSKRTYTVEFENIRIDSLNKLAANVIVSGQVASAAEFQYITDQSAERSAKANFEWVARVRFEESNKDSSRFQLKQLEIEYVQSLHRMRVRELESLRSRENELQEILQSAGISDYRKENAIVELKQVRMKINGFKIDSSAVVKVQREYERERELLSKEQLFSGKFRVLEIQ